MSRVRRLALCCAALVVPAVLHAHARLEHSSPADGARLRAAPTKIELEFSEAPELALTIVTLTMPGGSSVVLGPLTRTTDRSRGVVADVGAALGAGRYTIRWSTAAADGHPTKGVLSFTILEADSAANAGAMAMGDSGMKGRMSPMSGAASIKRPVDAAEREGFGVESPAYVVIRWLQFLALLVIIGAVAFRQLVLSFLKRKQAPDSAMIPDAARNAAHWGQRAAALLLAVIIARLVAQSYMMHGGMGGVAPSMMEEMLARTLWGRGWLLQLAGVLIAGLGFYGARSVDVSRWWLVATLGALLLAFSPALSGHASTSPRLTSLAILADGLHVIAAGGWLGSLLMVAAVGIPAAMRLPSGRRGPMVAEVVNAFSPTALMFAGVIATTGVFAAWLHLGSVSALWTSNYGKTLLIKLAILSIVAGTGAYNWLRVKPHLGHVDGAAKMKRSAMVELAVGVMVVLVTAVLVAVATPHEADLDNAPSPTSAHSM